MTTKREEWKPKGAWHVVNGHDGLVADVYGSAENVRRIAAVPDMEAALMRLLSCEAGIEASNWGGEDVLEEARAALRKAGRIS